MKTIFTDVNKITPTDVNKIYMHRFQKISLKSFGVKSGLVEIGQDSKWTFKDIYENCFHRCQQT